MPNLAFIRSVLSFDCWDYYESKTDVWVFGDVEGYALLEQKIRLAVHSKENIHLNLTREHPVSMEVVIVPATRTIKTKARVKFVERFVRYAGRPNMELVIFGNKAGLMYVAGRVKHVVREYKGNPSEHIHLDDVNDPQVVPRSVSLNLRAPFQKWSSKNL